MTTQTETTAASAEEIARLWAAYELTRKEVALAHDEQDRATKRYNVLVSTLILRQRDWRKAGGRP